MTVCAALGQPWCTRSQFGACCTIACSRRGVLTLPGVCWLRYYSEPDAAAMCDLPEDVFHAVRRSIVARSVWV